MTRLAVTLPLAASLRRGTPSLGRLDLDHIEVFPARPAVGAAPGQRDVVPARSGRDSFLGQSLGFVVDEAADQAHVLLHGRRRGLHGGQLLRSLDS